MKTIAIYGIIVTVILLVNYQKSEEAKSSSIKLETTFLTNLSQNTWVNIYQTNQALMTKSTWKFKENGEFTRTETFNYLGIKEYVEEKGIWNFEETKGILSVANSQSGEENTFKIQQVSPKEMKLVCLKSDKELNLVMSLD
jgi:hypothetical protein